MIYFDMNDFDEAMLMPVLWELARMAVSVQLSAEEAGLSVKKKNALVEILLTAYRHTIEKGKPLVMERQAARGLIKKMIRRVEDRKEMELIKKRTQKNNPDKLLPGEKLLALPKKEKTELVDDFNAWLKKGIHQELQAVDAGFRIAGTGSIGIRRYVLLLSDKINTGKKVLMDVKQAVSPASLAYTNIKQPVWSNEAERIISIQEMMEQATPAFLSSFEFKNNWYVVKELQPTGDKVDLFQTIKPEHQQNYLEDLGVLIAADQLRSSGRKKSASADEMADFVAAGNWIELMIDWSATRAEKMKHEYADFKQALEQGFFDA